MRIRRVVTGAATDGTGIVLADSSVDDTVTVPGLDGWKLARLWSTSSSHRDGTPTVPVDKLPPTSSTFGMPSAGDTQFILWQLPPFEVGPNPAGMHATDSIDYVVVVSGTVTCVLDGGEEINLDAGDCLVQGGNAHEWVNRSGGACVMAVVMIGASRP